MRLIIHIPDGTDDFREITVTDFARRGVSDAEAAEMVRQAREQIVADVAALDPEAGKVAAVLVEEHKLERAKRDEEIAEAARPLDAGDGTLVVEEK